MTEIHEEHQGRGLFRSFRGIGWSEGKGDGPDKNNPKNTRERGGLSSNFRAKERRSVLGFPVSNTGVAIVGRKEVNGRGLTRGSGFVNGLGFTKQGRSEPKGELSKMPYYVQTGLSNDKAISTSDGLQLDIALINGVSLAKEMKIEPPMGGLSRRKRKKRMAFKILQEKSTIPVCDIGIDARRQPG